MRFDEYSMWVQKKHDYDWYEWCVFLDEPLSVLQSVRFVEYALHPSFPEPIRTITEARDCFSLSTAGWGTFRIGIVVTLRSGEQIKADHDLRLANHWPTKERPTEFERPDLLLVYDQLSEGKYRWRKADTIAKATSLSTEAVSEALDALSAENLARKSPFLSVDNREMWGATSVVGISPRPRSG